MLLRASVILAATVGGVVFGSSRDQLPGTVRPEDRAEPGPGATLIVIAPDNLCENDLELIVARTVLGGRRSVFQTPVVRPQCRWTISDVREGDYQTVLQKARGDRHMVGMSRLTVYSGSTWTTTIAPMSATVEGLITVNRIPVGVGAYVEVIQNGSPGWSWETRTDRDGYYKVAVQADVDLCVRVLLPNALNFMFPQCQGFGPGSNRRDFDIPAGRIDVTLMPHDGPVHSTPILVGNSGAGGGGSASVTVTGRVERSLVGLAYGKHRVYATTMDYSHDFGAIEVTLSENEPIKSVTLSVPYSR